MRTEIFKRMYEKPIHPRNMRIDKEPLLHEDHDKIFRENIKMLPKQGVYTQPTKHYEGSKFIHPVKNRKMRGLENFWGGNTDETD